MIDKFPCMTKAVNGRCRGKYYCHETVIENKGACSVWQDNGSSYTNKPVQAYLWENMLFSLNMGLY